MEALVSVDVWSLGCILYELLTGERLFSGNKEEIIRKVLKSEIIYPEFISDEAEDLINLMLRIHVEERILVKEILSHRWIKGEKLEIFEKNIKIKDDEEFKNMDKVFSINTIESVVIHPVKRKSSSLDNFKNSIKISTEFNIVDKLKENSNLNKFSTARVLKIFKGKSNITFNKRNFTKFNHKNS